MQMFNLTFNDARHHYAFGQNDRVIVRGLPYTVAPHGRNEEGWLLELDDGSGRSQSMSHRELSRLGSMGQIRVERDYYAPKGAKRRLSTGETLISELGSAQTARVSKRSAYVEAFLELERQKLIKRTDEAIKASEDLLRSRAMALPASLRGGTGVQESQDMNKTPSARTLRRWLREYQALGPGGLIDAMNRRGNRNSLMGPEEQALLMREIRHYASEKRPTMKTIHENVGRTFAAYNEVRAAEGRYPFPIPSYETVRRAIHTLDPYAVMVAREGVEAARKKFMPVGGGLRLTMPLERVEIDENTIDVISFAHSIGLLGLLTEEEQKLCGLDKSKARWFITVAICATTRCIVGMAFSRSAREEASLQVLQMILSDKGKWADATGSLGSWDMHGTPISIVTDNGQAFKSERFRTACADLGITTMRAPAGLPEVRARNERFFHSLNTGLLPRLPGRTFSSIREKGDANPEAGAALTFDDLAFCLVRWIVDIYHNSPHAGLGGETPLHCWRRLTSEWGVQPPPDQADRRAIFGERLRRKLSKEGVAVLGMHYHSEELARCMTSRTAREVEVRWHPDDIGTVTVYVDGRKIQVGATVPGFNGVTARQWLAMRRELRAVDPARKAYDVRTIQVAIQAIDARSSAAMTVAGLLVDEWSPERIKQEEDRLFIGFRVTPDQQGEPRAADGIGRSIPDPEAHELPSAAPADRPAPQGPVSAQSERSASVATETPVALPEADHWTITE